MKTLFLVMFLLAGCSFPHWSAPKTPELSVTTMGGTQVRQSGDTPVPAKVDTTEAVTSVPLVKGQKLTIDATTGAYALDLSQATTISTKSVSTHLTGPTSFEPPKPPTVAEIKTEERKTWLYIAAFLGAAAGIFGLVRDWHLVMIGGFAATGSALFGLFIEEQKWVIPVIFIGAGVSIAGPYIYHTVVKQLQPK